MSFDDIIDRGGTWSLKWDNKNNVRGKPDILPFWVADMDFAPPPAVLDAIRSRADHPVFGYTHAPTEYFELLSQWYARRYGIVVAPDCFLLAPAVMPSIGAAIRAFSREGEGVLVLPPVYYPFFDIIATNGRVVVEAPLSRGPDRRWGMDVGGIEEAVERAAQEGTRTRIVLLSSPHNPVGRVFTGGELDSLVELAARRRIAVICDEIHADIVFPPHRFVSLAAVEQSRAAEVVVLGGPNKTFNLAGLHISHVVARDPETRAAVKRSFAASGFSLPNAFSLTAAFAAYKCGASWLDEALAYMNGNFGFLADAIGTRITDAAISPLEGTFLAWVDCAPLIGKLGLEGDRALANYLEETGRARFSPGSGFGTGGAGHMRINLACPRAMLSEGIERTAAAIALLGRHR